MSESSESEIIVVIPVEEEEGAYYADFSALDEALDKLFDGEKSVHTKDPLD